ncbi:MAG TPA: ABC transporter permease [Saprospiraceae bacterium]|nr:ABC transporter permease [Saprospiraceae bacterium]
MHAAATKKKISPQQLSFSSYLKRCWAYRRFLFTLSRRDIKAKYAQTVLGILWVVLQPLTGLAIFTLFFQEFIPLDTGTIPYPLFAFTGIVAWYFFAYIVTAAGSTLMENQDLIKKVYFPKLILPLTKVMLGLVDFGITFLLLIVGVLLSGYGLSWALLSIPFFLLLNIISGLAIAIWLSALTLQYRDLYHIIPYLINFAIWLTPVFYPGTIIPEAYDWVLYINPMAFVIAGFRWALLGDVMPNIYYLISLIPVLLLCTTGFLYFIRVEQKMVDIL